jgi:DNA-binding NtrC family response regulator
MAASTRVQTLIVEDSMTLATLCTSYLGDDAFDFVVVNSLKSARDYLDRATPELILLDVGLPDGNGLTLLDDYPPQLTGSQVVVMTALGSNEMAIDAVGRGAFDYLEKPFDADRLRVTVNNAITHHVLDSEVKQLKHQSFCQFVGDSMAMQGVYRIVEAVAASTATVFITGESGTGKELTASAVHQLSSRNTGTFHAINCGAIPGELMESALFGHVKGAFTGAIQAREGAAAIAHGGTLFLDEICEMDLELQTKMLRFIQTGEYQKVGSDKIETADVRFVCATNRDPLAEVAAGRFREDLYYRLHVVPIELPPLRERGEDILTIAEHFLKTFNDFEGKQFERFSASAARTLMAYPWPGNVRELQNVVQNAVVLNDDQVVDASMLAIARPQTRAQISQSIETKPTPALIAAPPPTMSSTKNAIAPLWLTEKQAIEAAIDFCQGNITQAAAMLEVSPSTIYRKKQSWDTLSGALKCTA